MYTVLGETDRQPFAVNNKTKSQNKDIERLIHLAAENEKK